MVLHEQLHRERSARSAVFECVSDALLPPGSEHVFGRAVFEMHLVAHPPHEIQRSLEFQKLFFGEQARIEKLSRRFHSEPRERYPDARMIIAKPACCLLDVWLGVVHLIAGLAVVAKSFPLLAADEAFDAHGCHPTGKPVNKLLKGRLVACEQPGLEHGSEDRVILPGKFQRSSD